MPVWTSFLIGAALLLLIGFLDWETGTQVALSLLYVVPITWITWRVGRWPGLGMAVASGACWLVAELMGHASYSNPLVPYWNGLIRTLLFCLISALESELLERKRVERGLRRLTAELEQRVQERTAQLQSLNASLERQVAERSAAAEERARRLAQSEADLQKQTGILESILNSMGDGVVVADSQGHLVHINPAARRMLRIPSADTDVVAWLESQESFLPNSLTEPSRHENPLLRAMRGEAVDGAEMLLRHASLPTGIWLSVSSRPLLDPAGKITGGVIVFSDISARKSLERQIAEVSDREQRRIGEDLHDGLCQHLVSVAFAARKLAAKLGEQSLGEAEEAAQIAELLGESIAQARTVARGLYLVPLEAGGLRSALEEFLMQVRSRHLIGCQFVERVSVPIADEMFVTALFRIAQEAINNALKHAQAKRITVTLSADAKQIELTVEDDGTGFRPDPAKPRGMGMHLMNYRARMMGAALEIGPRPGGGTIVSCSLRRQDLSELDRHVARG
jgi:two-component system, LuxR family, sensor kinase FixL